ncbi:unnamed protein product [Lampetra planeri]
MPKVSSFERSSCSSTDIARSACGLIAKRASTSTLQDAVPGLLSRPGQRAGLGRLLSRHRRVGRPSDSVEFVGSSRDTRLALQVASYRRGGTRRLRLAQRANVA